MQLNMAVTYNTCRCELLGNTLILPVPYLFLAARVYAWFLINVFLHIEKQRNKKGQDFNKLMEEITDVIEHGKIIDDEWDENMKVIWDIITLI